MSVKKLFSGVNAMVGIATGDLDKVRIHEILKKAEDGDAEAQYMMACYLLGISVKGFWPDDPEKFIRGKKSKSVLARKEENEALLWLEKSTLQDHAGALYLASTLVSYGTEYFEMNKEKGFSFLRKAAELGNVEAQYDFGCRYHRGEFVPQDKKLACEWWLKSTSKGDLFAAKELSEAYAIGDGVEQDTIQAIMWFRLHNFGVRGFERLDVGEGIKSLLSQLSQKQHEAGRNLAVKYVKKHNLFKHISQALSYSHFEQDNRFWE